MGRKFPVLFKSSRGGCTVAFEPLNGAYAKCPTPFIHFPKARPLLMPVLCKGRTAISTARLGQAGAAVRAFKIQVTPNGVWATVYSFGPPTASAGTFLTNLDGARPESALTPGLDGSFYGTTSQGGTGGNGTVFKVTTNGVLTTLHFFGAAPDGANPDAGLTLGPGRQFLWHDSKRGYQRQWHGI